MELSFYIILSVLFIIDAVGVIKLLRFNELDLDRMTVLSPFLGWIGVIAGGLFHVISLLLTIFTDGWHIYIFIAISLLGTALTLAYINSRIFYDDDGFTARNFLGFKRRYKYSDMTAYRPLYKKNSSDGRIYVGRRSVLIDKSSIGGTKFISLAKKRYKSLTGTALPEKSREKDIFKGNIRNTGEFIFAYVLVGIITLGMLIFTGWQLFFNTPILNEEVTEKHTVIFVEMLKNDDPTFRGSDGNIYEASDFNYSFSLSALADGMTALTVYTVDMDSEGDAKHYRIEAIFDGDRAILSFEGMHTLRVRNISLGFALFSGLLILWALIVIATIYVGRNVKRLPKRLVRLFFKEGYVNW